MIIPCHPSHRSILPRTLQSLEKASPGLDVETLVVDDVDARGLSWTRNQGLSRATGDYILFVDADDTVRPGFFRVLLNLAEETNPDFALSSFDYAPLKRDYNLTSNATIRSVMLPAFFGYSFDDVRRWNRVASTCEVLYDYVPGDNGILRSSLGSDRYWDYKFAALANRKDIASRVGGDALDYFAASAVFSALELLRARKDWRRYVADPSVAKCLREFPVSLCHPLAATAVAALRLYSSMSRK